MKKVISILLISILVIALSACGNSKSSSKSDTKGDPDYPKKPITLVVPSSAGGGTDITARALAKEAEDNLGESIGIENKPGASGSVGMTEGSNAKPDGYTVSMVFVELTMYKHLGISKLTPDQFRPVALVNLDPAALTVPANAPYDTLEEFIDYAKKHPGKVKVGNSGTGSIWHIAAKTIESATGAKFNHVPYEGAAPAVTGLVGGHIDAVTVSPAEVKTQVEAGKLKTLAVMSDKRSKILPDVPTFSEAGVDVDDIGTWRGITVPKDTPDDVVKKLEDAFTKAAKSDSFEKFMNKNGLGIEVKDSKGFKQFMDENYERFGKIIDDLNIDK